MMDVSGAISTQESIGRKAVKVLYPLFIGQFFGLILTAATFIIVTRLLGPSQYGVYVFAFGFSALVNGVAAFGVGAYFSSELAGLAYRKDGGGMLNALHSGYLIAGGVGVLLSIMGIALSGAISGVFPNVGITPLTIELASAQIFFYMISMIAVNGLVGLSRSGLASIANIAIDSVQLLLSVALTIMYGVNGAVAAMLIGYAFGALLGTAFIARAVSRYVKPRLAMPPREHLRKTFAFVWPIAANNFLNTGMANFSILFLGLFVTAAALGNYGAANRGLTLIAMLYGTFGQGLLNTFTTARSIKGAGEVNATYNSIMKFSLVFMLPVIVFVGVMAAPSMYLLISSGYADAPLFLTLMCIGTMVGVYGTNISNLLISGGHTRSVLYINLVSAVVQLVIILALVPGTKVVGAIISIYFIGNIVELILFVRAAFMKFRLHLEARDTYLLYAGNIVLGVVLAAWLLASNGIVHLVRVPDAAYAVQIGVAAIIAALLYPVLLVLLGAVDRKDLDALREATAKLGAVSVVMGWFLRYSEMAYARVAR